MRSLLLGVLLTLAACSSCVKNNSTAKTGAAEKGTRFECKDSHKVVNDPAKCDASR